MELISAIYSIPNTPADNMGGNRHDYYRQLQNSVILIKTIFTKRMKKLVIRIHVMAIITLFFILMEGCSYAGKVSDSLDAYKNKVASSIGHHNNEVFNDEQIEMIRKELYIPDSKIGMAKVIQGEAYLWEGMGLQMVPVSFYINENYFSLNAPRPTPSELQCFFLYGSNKENSQYKLGNKAIHPFRVSA